MPKITLGGGRNMTFGQQTKKKGTEIMQQASEVLDVDLSEYEAKNNRQIAPDATIEEMTTILIRNALENIDEANPNGTFLASSIYLQKLYKQAAENRNYDQ